MNITVETARQYLIERIGELKAQVPHGNPFVFLGAFAILRTLGRLFDIADYEVLRSFAGYDKDEAEVVSSGASLMFERFTLTHPKVKIGYTEETSFVTFSNYVNEKLAVAKLDLSHKDRNHRKRANNKLTLSANAFLEDVEGAINKAFDSVKDDELAGAQLFVNINSQPLIGYGD